MRADDLASLPCCRATLALVEAGGSSAACPTCGTLFYVAPDNDVHAASGERASPPPPRLLPLAEVIPDVALALRWRREQATGAELPRATSPLARLQGRSSGADEDASASTTGQLWRLVRSPGSKVGRKAREGFVDALVRFCDETSRPPEEEPDWRRARVLAEQLGRLEAEHRAALVALARRSGPAVGWDVACLVVADECAPPALRATWTQVRRAAGVGRPRVDRTEPPPEAVALAWGRERLTAALAAWSARGA